MASETPTEELEAMALLLIPSVAGLKERKHPTKEGMGTLSGQFEWKETVCERKRFRSAVEEGLSMRSSLGVWSDRAATRVAFEERCDVGK